jgi:hypothetical protein
MSRKLIVILLIAGAVMFIVTGCGHSASNSTRPVAVQQPASAKSVAAQVGCDQYVNLGRPSSGMVVQSGTCWVGSKKYGVDTFVSQAVRDQWLKAAEPLGVIPTWETSTSVIYPSVA